MRGTSLLIAGLFVVGAASCGSSVGAGNAGTTAPVSTTAAAVGDAGLPVVSGPVNAKPTIKIPSTPAPKELVVKVLVEGTGAVVRSEEHTSELQSR